MKKGCLIIILVLVAMFAILLGIAVFLGDELGATPEGKLAKELEVSVEDAEVILETFREVGIDEYTFIEHDELLDNAHFEGERGFRISGREFSNVILYLNPDSSIYQIKFADNILFENNETLTNINDFILTNQQKSRIQYEIQETIKKLLKSPSTAEFPNILEWYIEKVDGEIIVRSYVDSQNGFGATIRSEFQIKIKEDEITSLIIDGKEYIQ